MTINYRQETAAQAPQLSWIRERLAEGEYEVSEHVLRFQTAGKLSAAAIETALSVGWIIEFRRTQAGELASLVCGRVGRETVNVLCSRDARQRLIVLLAYPEIPPGWEEEADITLTMRSFMAQDTTRCFFCGGEIKAVVVGNFDYRSAGDLYVIKNVPAGLCLQCGEKYVAAPVAKMIDACIADGRFDSADVVRIIDYRPPA